MLKGSVAREGQGGEISAWILYRRGGGSPSPIRSIFLSLTYQKAGYFVCLALQFYSPCIRPDARDGVVGSTELQNSSERELLRLSVWVFFYPCFSITCPLFYSLGFDTYRGLPSISNGNYSQLHFQGRDYPGSPYSQRVRGRAPRGQCSRRWWSAVVQLGQQHRWLRESALSLRTAWTSWGGLH